MNPNTMAREVSDTELLEHLSMLETRAMQAAGTDASVIKELLADDFFEFGRSGVRWDKAGILAMQRTSGTHAQARDFALTRLGNDHALLTYVSVTAEGADSTLRSSIWALRGGRWQMVFHQGTKAAQK